MWPTQLSLTSRTVGVNNSSDNSSCIGKTLSDLRVRPARSSSFARSCPPPDCAKRNCGRATEEHLPCHVSRVQRATWRRERDADGESQRDRTRNEKFEFRRKELRFRLKSRRPAKTDARRSREAFRPCVPRGPHHI